MEREKKRSRINKDIPAITPNSYVINDTNFIGTRQVGIAGIVSVSINNTIFVDPPQVKEGRVLDICIIFYS